MQVIRVRLNQEHIDAARRTGSGNPLITAIVEATACRWFMTECGSGIEATAPHRQFLLQGDILNLWRLYRATGEIAPCIFYLGLYDSPTQESNEPQHTLPAETADNQPAA